MYKRQTFTAANDGQSWLPLVKAANPDLLDSIMSARQYPVPDYGPSALLQQFGQRKLPDWVRTQPKKTSSGQEDAENQQPLDKSGQHADAAGTGEATSKKQSADSLGQVAIRVFSLANTAANAAHIHRQASHLARGTGAHESPGSCTRDLLCAPWQSNTSSLMSELLASVPQAPSWEQRSAHRAASCHRTQPAASAQEVRSPQPLVAKVESAECGSREVGAPVVGEARSGASAPPAAVSSDEPHRADCSIPMMTPVMDPSGQ